MKKNIIIWANCQGGVLGTMLNKYYIDMFDIHYFANYEYIRESKPLPEIFNKCDIFLFQNYLNKDETYCMENIINNIIPINSINISFPTLHRNYLQFCYDNFSPENENTICPEKPHGDFFYGIQNIRDIVKKLKDAGLKEDDIIEKTLEAVNEVDFIPNEQIIKYENETIDFLKTKAFTSDIPNIYYFIINNYKRIRLYHNPNHPNGILLNELCKEIFIKLGLNYPDENENIIFLENSLKDWKMPIFKSICNYYNIIEVDNECFASVHSDIFDEISYIKKYVSFLYKNIII
jgi:hypothetical protein